MGIILCFRIKKSLFLEWNSGLAPVLKKLADN